MQAMLVIPATLDSLERITPFIDSLLPEVSSLVRAQVALAVHELCMNIVQHGYAGADGEIELRAAFDDHKLELTIIDTAPNAFDPTASPEQLDPILLPERGWGMLIVRQVMDEVNYDRLATGNAWRLAKAHSGARGAS